MCRRRLIALLTLLLAFAVAGWQWGTEHGLEWLAGAVGVVGIVGGLAVLGLWLREEWRLCREEERAAAARAEEEARQAAVHALVQASMERDLARINATAHLPRPEPARPHYPRPPHRKLGQRRKSVTKRGRVL